MNSILALMLIALVAAASANRLIDDFTITQRVLVANDDTPSDEVSVTNAAFLGGERDTGLTVGTDSLATCTDPLASTTNVSPTGELGTDVGIFIAANDQSCFSRAVIQYDGADNSIARSLSPGLGAQSNFKSFSTTFHVQYYSDLRDGTINVNAVSGNGNVCTAVLKTSGNNQVDDKLIPFSSFTQACDFGDIRVLEIEIPAQINFDVIFSLIELVSASLTGRVWYDCSCNGQFESASGDYADVNAVVTATPTGNCPAGTPVSTGTTAADGTYRIEGLNTCTYSVAVAGETCNASANPRSVTGLSTAADVTGVNFYRPIPATLSGPAPITVECGKTAPATTATLSSACGTSTVSTFTDVTTTNQVCDSGSTPGQNRVVTRTFTAQGQTATQTITYLRDQTAPTITAPADKTITCAQAPADPSVTPITIALGGSPSMTDECTTPTFTFTDSVSGTCDTAVCGAAFTVTRTFRATDSCGNQGVAPTAQTITRGACTSSSFVCPILSTCGANPPPPPPPNVPPPPPDTGDCNGNTNSRTTNTLSQGGNTNSRTTNTLSQGNTGVDTNSLTTNTNSRSTVTSDDFTGASIITNSRTTLTNSENVGNLSNTKTTVTSDDFDGANLVTNSRTSLTNSENLAGSPTPNTSNGTPLAVDSSANTPDEDISLSASLSGSLSASLSGTPLTISNPLNNSPNNSPNASPNASNSANNSPNATPNNSNSANASPNASNSNNSSATSLVASFVALVALFFLF